MAVVVRDMDRASEHQVLKEVRKPCLVGLLVTRADFIQDVYRYERRAPVGVANDGQPVAQNRACEWNHRRVKMRICLIGGRHRGFAGSPS